MNPTLAFHARERRLELLNATRFPSDHFDPGYLPALSQSRTALGTPVAVGDVVGRFPSKGKPVLSTSADGLRPVLNLDGGRYGIAPQDTTQHLFYDRTFNLRLSKALTIAAMIRTDSSLSGAPLGISDTENGANRITPFYTGGGNLLSYVQISGSPAINGVAVATLASLGAASWKLFWLELQVASWGAGGGTARYYIDNTLVHEQAFDSSLGSGSSGIFSRFSVGGRYNAASFGAGCGVTAKIGEFMVANRLFKGTARSQVVGRLQS